MVVNALFVDVLEIHGHEGQRMARSDCKGK